MGAASEFSADRFGGPVRRVSRTVSVGTAQVLALRGNSNRLGAFITNVGTSDITLDGDSPIAAGVGFLLLGNGATYQSTVDQDGDSVALPLFAISSAAGGSIRVVEYIRETTGA